MSDGILKALMQLFAIIAKQDDGATASERKFVEEFLYFQLSEDLVKEYLVQYDEFVGPVELDEEGNHVKKLTSVKDSVRTLGFILSVSAFFNPLRVFFPIFVFTEISGVVVILVGILSSNLLATGLGILSLLAGIIVFSLGLLTHVVGFKLGDETTY